MPETFRIFVAWDSTADGVGRLLERLAVEPNRERREGDPELEVEVPMLETDGGDLWDNVAKQIRGARGLLAFLDTPDANVAFEVGYALGLGKDGGWSATATSSPIG